MVLADGMASFLAACSIVQQTTIDASKVRQGIASVPYASRNGGLRDK